MRILTTEQERWLYEQSAKLWARYIDMKHNSDQVDQIKAITPDSELQTIYKAYRQ